MLGNRSSVSQPQHRGSTIRASDASQAAICAGANFSIYVVRELIGVGSTASVYRAHDTRLRREVALKVLNTEVLAGADGLARFLHEARMAAAVRHPNVVSIFDVGVHDGTPFIVMELLTGGDLDRRLNAARVLREPVLIDIAMQLASGLAAVHDAGVVHRDLRPSNVFLARGPDGSTQAKLLDFGVSKQTRDNLRLTTNGRRRWAAMPLYTAPEVLLDGDATFHSDQYSLGVLLYECVTGVHPFRADTLMESIEFITAGQARPILDQPIRPSRRLAAIIERAMHVYPDERFTDLHELGRSLASLSGRRAWWPWGASPVAPTRQHGSARPVRSATQQSPGFSWAFGAAVIGCSIAAPLWAWWSGHRHRPTAPVSVTSPLAPGEGRAPAAAPPANTSAVPWPAAARVRSSQPVVEPGPHASAAPDAPPAALEHAASPGGVESPAPERDAPPAPERAEPTAAASFAELAGVADAAPRWESAQPELPGPATPGGDPLDSGLSPQDDGTILDMEGPVGVPGTSVTAPPNGPERGTNGALIFD